MALSTEERLKLALAEKKAVVTDLAKSLDLLEYYRDLAPENCNRGMPPAHYWIKPNNDTWVYGRVVGGRLKPLGKQPSEDDAIAACWADLDGMTARQVTQKPKPSREHLDLDDLKDEPAPTTRRRRRRVTDD